MFRNPFNRERHETQIHKKQKVSAASPSPVAVVHSPMVTRRRKQPANSRGQIFDFENDAVARQLRDQTMKEVNDKFAQQRKEAAEERRAAVEARNKNLEEKNRLADENEKKRNAEQEQRVLRSETAVKNLIESRKRRR